MTYTAFCRNNGTHSTKGAGGYHCWNDELVEHTRDQLSPRWDSIRTWLVSQNDALERAIAGSFEDLRILLQSELERAWLLSKELRVDFFLGNEIHAPHSIGNLLASMEPRQRFIVHQTENSIDKIICNTEYSSLPFNHYEMLIRSFSILTRDMLHGHASSYMATLMRPAYVSCTREGGKLR